MKDNELRSIIETERDEIRRQERLNARAEIEPILRHLWRGNSEMFSVSCAHGLAVTLAFWVALIGRRKSLSTQRQSSSGPWR